MPAGVIEQFDAAAGLYLAQPIRRAHRRSQASKGLWGMLPQPPTELPAFMRTHALKNKLWLSDC